MNPIIIILICLFLFQLYKSIVELKRESFKNVFYTTKLDEFDLERIKNINEIDSRFTAKSIDSNNIIVERKLSMWDFGFAFLITINNGNIELYFYDRILLPLRAKMKKQDIIHLLKMNRII